MLGRAGSGDADTVAAPPEPVEGTYSVRDNRIFRESGAMTSTRDGLDRRAFLRLFGVAATTVVAGGLLQACGSTASTPAPTSAPAKPAESKPAEAAKPAAPAAQAAATTAPAAAKPDAKPAAAGDIAVPT